MVFKEFRMPLGSLAALALLELAGACASPDKGYVAKDFLTRNLSGKVQQKDWTYKYAYVDPSINTPEEDDYVYVFLAEKPAQACPKSDENTRDYRVVMVAAPKVATAK